MIIRQSLYLIRNLLFTKIVYFWLLPSTAWSGQTLYTNAFESSTTEEWTLRRQDSLPTVQNKFLGRFTSQTTTLSLTNLPTHNQILLSYDLYIIASWDGNEPIDSGPDVYTVRLDDGQIVMRTSFSMHDLTNSNIIRTQSFPGRYPVDNYNYGAGAFATNSLGYPNWAIARSLTSGGFMETNSLGFKFRCTNGPVKSLLFDTVYRLQHLISHTNDSIKISHSFSSPENNLSDESWGLDNLSVSIPSIEDLQSPTISQQPQSTITSLGKTVTINAVVRCTYPMTYQWRKGGRPIPSATNSTFRLPRITAEDTGHYDVVVTNSAGSATSEPAMISIPGLPAELMIQMHPGPILLGSVGQNYTIQFSSNSSDPASWLSITNITLQEPRQVWIDQNPVDTQPGDTKRFYRAILGP